ncbi:hypothetical protein [Actinokineospora sp. HUAS TT18]|uniref:hypothetical protein n=1 Tax=Actinokineospora sp. HUAS TT18 TaxID=3447451 RepID=UPI003F522635
MEFVLSLRPRRWDEVPAETLRAALNALAAAVPDWLVILADPEWFDRYRARSEDTRFPSRWAARAAHAEQVGADGRAVLSGLAAPGAPRWLRELPAVELLRRNTGCAWSIPIATTSAFVANSNPASGGHRPVRRYIRALKDVS